MESLNTLLDTLVMGAELLSLSRPRARRKARAANGKHLALFAWALPPHSTAGVYRPLSFIRYGARLGWRIDAFCGAPQQKQSQHGDELLALLPREATIHVVPASTREPSYRFFPRIDGGFSNALELARYALTSMREDPPDAILASGPPFFAFVSAYFVARRLGVPLVLDYRDEWSECPFDFVTKNAGDREWERRCLRTASAVLFTTESHRTHQLAVFPELDARKTHVVPNGWEPDDFVRDAGERSSHAADARTKRRIAHVGNLAGHTPVDDFLGSLGTLLTEHPEWAERITVQFIGRRSLSADKAIRAFEFPGALEIIDHVGKREANRLMQASDVLLLLTNKSFERYLPGKLFDYLAAHNPVLVYGFPGEASAVVDRLGAGVLCAPGSGEALRSALEQLQVHDMSRGDPAVHEWLEEHRRDTLASRAFGIIGAVTAST